MTNTNELFDLVEEKESTPKEERTFTVVRKNNLSVIYDEQFEVPAKNIDEAISKLKNSIGNEEYKWQHKSELVDVKPLLIQY